MINENWLDLILDNNLFIHSYCLPATWLTPFTYLLKNVSGQWEQTDCVLPKFYEFWLEMSQLVWFLYAHWKLIEDVCEVQLEDNHKGWFVLHCYWTLVRCCPLIRSWNAARSFFLGWCDKHQLPRCGESHGITETKGDKEIYHSM